MNFNWTHDSQLVTIGKPGQGEIFKIAPPLGFPSRRVYAFIDWLSDKTSVIGVYAEIVLKKSGQVAGVIPFVSFSSGGTTPGSKGAVSLLSAGGNPVRDSAILTVPVPLDAGLATVALQGLTLRADIDQMALNVTSVYDPQSKMNGFYMFLGCASFA